MADQKAEKINSFVARDYQLKLLNKALERNIIVCLGTGTGKTFISVLLIKELLYQTYESNGGKRTVFLAPTNALARQQSKVLMKFLEVKVGCFTGRDDVDLYTDGRWKKVFHEHVVLVMTPAVFANILNARYYTLDKVNLLIFDECHAATGDSSYVEIMRTRYRDLPNEDRPKIFSLTAAVINRKVKPEKVEKEIIDLCHTLNSTLATSLNAFNFGTKPNEVIVTYKTSLQSSQIASQIGGISEMNPLGHQILRLLTDVGPLGTLKSLVHRRQTTEHIIGKGLASEQRKEVLQKVLDILKAIEESLLKWSENVKCGAENPYPLIRPDGGDALENSISPKVCRLVEILRACHQRSSSLRCVIFAQQRYTVFALWCCLVRMSNQWPEHYGFIKAGFIMGASHNARFSNSKNRMFDFCDERYDDELEEFSLNEFRNGKINVLIATSVIEEGIDIPECNCVVRFDEPLNLRSYIQSRGRARAKPSIFALLCAECKFTKISEQLREFKDCEVRVVEHCLNHHMDILDCAEVETALANDPDLPFFYAFPEKPQESALISAQSARGTLQWYCDSLGSDKFQVLRPRVHFRNFTNGEVIGVQCSIQLPKESKLYTERIHGKVMPNKVKAKVSAALETCKRLYELNELTQDLVPRKRRRTDVYVWTDEEVPDDVKNLFDGKSVTQKMSISCKRQLAEILQAKTVPLLPTKASVIVFRSWLLKPHNRNSHIRTFSPDDEPLCFGLMVFGAFELPNLPEYPLFTENGHEVVKVEQISDIAVSEELWNSCCEFNKYVFETVLRIPKVMCDPNITPVIVPVCGSNLDIVSLNAVSRRIAQPVSLDSVVTIETPENKTVSSYVGQLFNRDGVCRVSLSRIPNLIDYLSDKYGAAKQYKEHTSDAMKLRYSKRIENCRVEYLSASQWSKALTIPSCIYRLNRLLVAESFRQDLVSCGVGKGTNQWPPMTCGKTNKKSTTTKLDIELDGLRFMDLNRLSGPSAADIYAALSPLSANDIVDSERYEVLGDSFLKIAATLHLFTNINKENEGQLSMERSRITSNINLLSLAVPKGLHEAVESVQFAARVNFLPPGFVCDGNDKHVHYQKYKSKICSDSIEALIGVYLEKSGAQGAFEFLSYLGLPLGRAGCSFEERMSIRYDPRILGPETPDYHLADITRKHKHNLDIVERTLGYNFSNPLYLLEAITHQSYPYNRVTHAYERLEFLGDAVIDYVVSRFIYHNNPQLSPGQMTTARSSMVCNATFARAIVKHNLHTVLLHHSMVLQQVTDIYLTAISSGTDDHLLVCDSETEEVNSVDIPKPLGDLMESLIGAVFLDSNMNFDLVWTIFRRLMGDDLLVDMLTNIRKNPSQLLIEKFPKGVHYGTRVVNSDGTISMDLEVNKARFQVVSRNKKVAKIALAKKALRYFEDAEKDLQRTNVFKEIARELSLL